MQQPYTAERCIRDALARLGVLQAGQDPSAEDHALARDRLDLVLADLSGRRIVYIPDPDDIPLAMSQWVSAALGIALVADFGVGNPALPDMQTVDAQLRVIQAQAPSREPARACYF